MEMKLSVYCFIVATLLISACYCRVLPKQPGSEETDNGPENSLNGDGENDGLINAPPESNTTSSTANSPLVNKLKGNLTLVKDTKPNASLAVKELSKPTAEQIQGNAPSAVTQNNPTVTQKQIPVEVPTLSINPSSTDSANPPIAEKPKDINKNENDDKQVKPLDESAKTETPSLASSDKNGEHDAGKDEIKSTIPAKPEDKIPPAEANVEDPAANPNSLNEDKKSSQSITSSTTTTTKEVVKEVKPMDKITTTTEMSKNDKPKEPKMAEVPISPTELAIDGESTSLGGGALLGSEELKNENDEIPMDLPAVPADGQETLPVNPPEYTDDSDYLPEDKKQPIVPSKDEMPVDSKEVIPPLSSKDIVSEVHPPPEFPEQEDSHFFAYFVTAVIVFIVGYLLVHNKQKILAIVVEGRINRRRRSHSYKKLSNEGKTGLF